MKKNMYIQPALTVQDIDTESLMASMSVHDEIGDGQLSKEIFFEEEEEDVAPKSVWDE
ncbi:MAG: hypothetical protein IJK42_11720 [Prevotella sp.]|nr:hypothetical protein [Prevotella sp.]MBQ6210419.1 hypothetical protein [Prevotella sp.]